MGEREKAELETGDLEFANLMQRFKASNYVAK